MKDKNNIVVGVGLAVIICIVALVVLGNANFTNLSIKATNATNSLLIQQRDMEIKKLVKQLKAKQAELDDIKTRLSSAHAKIENIKAGLADIKSTVAK